MRIHSLWELLTSSNPLNGPQLCIGSGVEGLSAFLEVWGSIIHNMAQEEFQFQSDLTLAKAELKQRSLFEDNLKKIWQYYLIDSGKSRDKEQMLKQVVEGSNAEVLWIVAEKKEPYFSNTWPECAVILPTKAQWTAILAKAVPSFDGEVLVPQTYYEAAEFLKSLFLTGEYGGEAQTQLAGTAWQKLQYLWDEDLNLTSLQLSDLMHVAYCIETIQKKISFPEKSPAYVPPFFLKKLTPIASKGLVKQGVGPLVRLLTAIQKVDPDEGTRALSEWIRVVQRLSTD